MAEKGITLSGMGTILDRIKTWVNTVVAQKVAAVVFPLATKDVLGGIKAGAGIDVAADGTASVDFKTAKDYTDAQINGLKSNAPEAYDTLGEIAKALQDEGSASAALTKQIAAKANTKDVYSRTDADKTFVKPGDIQYASDADVSGMLDKVFPADQTTPAA